MITVVSWFNYYRGFKCKVCPLGEKKSFDVWRWIIGIGGVFSTRHGLHVRELVGLCLGIFSTVNGVGGGHLSYVMFMK